MDVFLKDEKQEVVSLYKTLRREYAEPFEGKRYFRMKSAIMQASADGRLHRDIFGFNPLVNALQTAILVCEEIGQNKDAVQSCLLAPFFSTTESLDKLGKVFGNFGCSTVFFSPIHQK